MQHALTRQDMSCTYLAHRALESVKLVLSAIACLQTQIVYQVLAQTELSENARRLAWHSHFSWLKLADSPELQ